MDLSQLQEKIHLKDVHGIILKDHTELGIGSDPTSQSEKAS